uniref:Galectin domain-containing protein n=1 Tax=Meloidogyne hapla TaxID=6305 RepID=A0A1I8BTS5_MELHA
MDKATEIFKKNNSFHCDISMKNAGQNGFLFTIYVNNKESFNYTGKFPFWATNWIKAMGTDEKNQIFKHEFDYLPFNGSVFCIEGSILPTGKVGTNEVIFEIYLMHESNYISSEFGDILLNMEFIFMSINHGTPLLEMSSQLFGGDWTAVKQHNNPIGQPGVEFKVAIHVEEYRFGIQINDGIDYVYYNYTAPAWMVNWIMVSGNVKNVKFDKEAQKCQDTAKQQTLPNYITKIDPKNPLKEGNYVIVKGILENEVENISINFYHEALGLHEIKGNIVLQANITTSLNIISFNSRIKGKYVHENEEKTLNPPLKKGQKFSMVFLINEGKFEIYYEDEEIYKYENKLPVWAIQYIVAGCGVYVCIKSNGDMSDGGARNKVRCLKGETKCYVSGDIKKGDGTTFGARYFASQGCGECPVPSIPCRSCSSNLCNNGKFFRDVNYCWDTEEAVEACKSEEAHCYYAVINDNRIEQGCNDTITWNETNNIQIVKCSMPICNTKDLYDKTLFCLNKGKDDLETKKARDKCYDEICFVHRHWDDGKLEQGCGKCPENVHSTDCITCKTKFCNEESKVKKFCWDDNSSDKKCRTSFDDYCFAERKQNNKFEYSVNKGCGNCSTLACKSCKENLCNDGKNIPNNFCLNSDGKSAIDCDDYECYINLDGQTGCGNCDKNKINEPCVDCKGLNCNTKDIIKDAIFCNVKEGNGNEKKGNRKCLDEKLCFISVDLNKVKDEVQDFKKYTKQGCGKCSSSNKIPCRICNTTKFCNSEKFFKQVNFCWVKEGKVIECEINERNCYYALNKENEVIQGCGKGLENLLNVNCEGNLCNTKELFDKTLFCLKKGKKDLNICNQKCYVWRHENGNLEQGCGECSKNSTECQTCNNQKFCNLENKVNKHCYKHCYIAKIEVENGEDLIEQFHYDCGKCPSNILLNLTPFIQTKNIQIKNKLMKINMSNIQCAHCNKSSACNADPFFESQLFFQGCGKCTEQQNLTKCINCSTPLCNTNEILPSPIKCFHQNTNFQQKTNKTCHHIYDSCYIARDIFWRDSNGIYESNCGKCPEEIQTNCAQCNNTPLCNTEKLLKNSFYCLEFTEYMEKTDKSYIGCESQCFVERIESGQLRQGCQMCGINQTREECFNCNTNYCNKENKVHKQCWVKNKKLCNSSHNSYCFMERNSTNEINKGCDNCSTLACKKCFDHRCNNWKDIPYYCYSFNGTTKIVKECSFTEPDCYIVKINNKGK